MHVYCRLICDEPASSRALVTSSGYFSEQVKVKTIAKATIAKLSEQPTLLDTFAKFPVEMIMHYHNVHTDTGLQPANGSVDILTARSKMLRNQMW